MSEANTARQSTLFSTLRRYTPPDSGSLLGMISSATESIVLILSLWVVAFLIEGELHSRYLVLSIIVFSITFPGSTQPPVSLFKLITDVLGSWIWTASLLLLLGFATRYFHEYPSEAIIAWLWVAPLSQIGAQLTLRLLAPHIAKLQGPPKRAIIVGMNEQGVALARRIRESQHASIELVGFFDDRCQQRLDAPTDLALLGKLSELSAFVKENRTQFIYLSLPMASQPRILQVLDDLKDTTASIYFVPDMFITDLIQSRAAAVCGMTVISVCETPFKGGNGLIKRLSDILLSLLILILISPILLIIAIAVKLDSPGSVIFKQRRYGLDGEEIVVYKFRSMKVSEDGDSVKQASRNDSRITRLGGFLRKSSLDELPQFINVLQGRMSIVGPRPHAVAHNELYRKLIKGYMIRHKVKPGITGWAQINGFRGETETLEKMQARIDFDLDYLRNWSLRFDLQIIARTVLVLANDKAAY
ncbi:undecaprenyl-phosphate glucose phosphotransferase [Chitinimonas arctica]|uniref:Undecaprenyl-phosphate glucose phosphotransferase n=1 Tax=Chitinimonas arctica TaxID=2594795 RepID=A0A516SEU2_9NEIS|nr:undecaprenyl-phosphate glucose phosphotransferase [Chitinimonas arctica]QDQ26663.1 undecaprenyl-phosphate glucose phosphotransferase [Chitinimonas arctica]